MSKDSLDEPRTRKRKSDDLEKAVQARSEIINTMEQLSSNYNDLYSSYNQQLELRDIAAEIRARNFKYLDLNARRKLQVALDVEEESTDEEIAKIARASVTRKKSRFQLPSRISSLNESEIETDLMLLKKEKRMMK
jgi:hypothetical protein